MVVGLSWNLNTDPGELETEFPEADVPNGLELVVTRPITNV